MATREAAFAVDGVELAYEERGTGPSVLFVHGTAANLWGETVDLVAGSCRTITYDRRSFGRSESLPLADSHRHTTDAAALIEHLEAAPAVVVGWSIGAVFALELAISHPELVRGLLLVDPAVHLKRHPTPRMVSALLAMQILRRTRGAEPAAERFLRWALRYRDGGTALDRAPEAWRRELRRNSAAIVRETDAGTGEHLRRAQIAAIRAPVICLVGALSDPAFVKAGERLARTLPAARLRTVTGAGHLMQLDRPQDIAAAAGELQGS